MSRKGISRSAREKGAKWPSAYAIAEEVEYLYPVTFRDVIERGDGRWIRARIVKFAKGHGLPTVALLDGATAGSRFQVLRMSEIRKIAGSVDGDLVRKMKKEDAARDCARLGRALEAIHANQSDQE